MRSDLTDITVVMDRSGSMSACQDGAEKGLNEFIGKQKALPGDALFTLVQFDTEYEFVHKGKPIKDVGHCSLVPRGWTALLDAVGRAIVETGERLKATDESQRPGLVVFVILTDGQENSSREFKRDKIKEMIEHQRSAYNWQFTFLGANQDAFAEAGRMGIPQDAAANYGTTQTDGAFAVASDNVGVLRSATARGEKASYRYSDAQRQAIKG